MRNILISIFVCLFILTSVSAADLIDKGTYKQNDPGQFRFTCDLENGLPCGASYSCNVTIQYPNSSLLINNKLATLSNNEYNITLPDTSVLGDYKNVIARCTNGTNGGSTAYWFDITPNGYRQSTSQGIISFVLILTIAIGSLVFLVLGWKFFDDERFWFFGVLFFALSVILILYFFGSSITYSRDLAYSSGSQNDQENVFRMILLVTRTSLLFILPFIIWYGYDSWKQKKKSSQANDGWDNNEY